MRFVSASAVLIVLAAFLLGLLFRLPGDAQAIRVSAVIAFAVQVFAFAVVLVVAGTGTNVFPAWGLGMLLRLASLAVMGFWLVRTLGLRAEPALISLATFFFVTTPVEQIHVGPRGDRLTGSQAEPVDIIMPHITDSHSIDLPYWGEKELPRWAPVRIGSIEIDFSPTKHVVMLAVAAVLCMLVLIPAAIAHE